MAIAVIGRLKGRLVHKPGDVDADEPTQIDDAGVRQIRADLFRLRLGAHTFEAAHSIDRDDAEKWKRRVSFLVLILSAANATTVVTALAVNQGTWAKVTVGVLTVATAIVAAVNEKGPWGDKAIAHGKAATSFNDVERKAIALRRAWATGEIDTKKVKEDLAELEATYDTLEHNSPDVRTYDTAREWARLDELWFQDHGPQPLKPSAPAQLPPPKPAVP